MKLNYDKLEELTELKSGDILTIRHKGMGEPEAFVLAVLGDDNDHCGVSLDGLGYLLGGTYYNFENLLEDVMNEPLIVDVKIYPSEKYLLNLESI